MFAAFILLSACSDEVEISEPEYLPVTYANVAGTWQLAEWNGTKTDGKRYCYLVIGRKKDAETGKRSIEMYTNIDSDKSRYITSTYELEDIEGLHTIISGLYDHSAGFWNNSYIISELEEDRMVWTVQDDAEDVSVYVRAEFVPEDIVNGTRSID